MKLCNVSFATWLSTHRHKDPQERWLRELYPWPVFAQVDCAPELIGVVQKLTHDEQEFEVTLKSIQWQESHGTFRYRMYVETAGLGWHGRALSDTYDLCAAPDGRFVTLFHTKKKEPLEKIARAFFARRWSDISQDEFRSLTVSRFLTASLISGIIEKSNRYRGLQHYPTSRLVGSSPMFARSNDIRIGYRYFSEDVYKWARASSHYKESVLSVYFAETKYQIDTTLPPNARVTSATEFDEAEGGICRDLINVLLRMEVPQIDISDDALYSVVYGRVESLPIMVSDADVHESLAVLKSRCNSKQALRYHLSAAVVINAWIDQERKAGFVQRKKFYAFKQQIPELVMWAKRAQPEGVCVWREVSSSTKEPALFIRIDGVDFSFHAIPKVVNLADESSSLRWSGVRLKPIAPIVLRWARGLFEKSQCSAP